MKTRITPDIWGILGISLLFIVSFFKSIFGEKVIAKLGLIYNVDAFFNSSLKQAIIPLTCDPSGFLIFFPNGFFAQKNWSFFSPPLWNPLSGCGYPILGDPQSFIFSPLLALGLFSTPGAYNFELLLEILLAMFGVYALCRFFACSVVASVLAATAYGFCPHLLVNTDLSGAECFIPWVFLVFARLSGKLTLLKVGIAAACALVLVASAHPESSLFAVAYGLLFGAVLRLLRRTETTLPADSGNGSAVKKQLNPFFATLALFSCVGLLLAGLAAPLVIPFLEFLNTGYIYKSASSVVARVLVSDFMLELFAAKNSQPFYLGSILISLVPFAFFVRHYAARATLLTASIVFVFSLPGDWLLPILSQRPFSFLATLYGLPELLILLCLSAAFVFDWFLERRFSKKLWFALAITLLLVLSAPFFVAGGFKQSAQMLGASKTYFWIGVTGSVLWLTLLYWNTVRRPLPVLLVAMPALIGNLAFEAVFARSSLPPVPAYSMQESAPITFLQKSGARIATVGSNFFLPNLQLNYGIQAVGSFNPMVPRRYHDFILRCRAQCHNLYFYDFPQRCSKLLDLASIKYVVTRTAIYGAGQGAGVKVIPRALPRRITIGMRLLDSDCVFDPTNSQIEGHVDLKVHESCSLRYAIQPRLLAENGDVLWEGPQELIDMSGAQKHFWRYPLCIPVPERIKANLRCYFGFSIADTWTGLVPPLDSNVVLPVNATFIVGQAGIDKSLANADSSRERHYELVREYIDGTRIYENLRSLPPAYAVSKVKLVTGERDVLSMLDSDSYDPRKEAIVEDQEANFTGQKNIDSNGFIPGELKRPNVNTLLVDISTSSPSLLVVTDLFYPGWICTVDGRPEKIYCVNYIFRGVKLSAGKHKVIFRYEPQSFQIGIVIAFLTLATMLLLALLNRYRNDELNSRRDSG